jgi:transcriptional regulator with XRE-family HTH domain
MHSVMTIARTLRELRLEKGWTQKRAASEIGVHPVTYSDYENGKMTMSGPTLQRTARAFGVNPLDIDLSHRDAVA